MSKYTMTITMALFGVVAAEFYKTNNTISNEGNLTTYYNSINVTEFKQDVLDEIDMLDCIEHLGIEHGTWTTTNVKDFESIDSLVNVDEEILEWFTETWYPVTSYSGQMGIQDGNNTRNSLFKEKHNPQGVDVDAYTNNSCACCYGSTANFIYWPIADRVILSHSYRSAPAFSYLNYKIKFEIYSYHYRESGELVETVNVGGTGNLDA